MSLQIIKKLKNKKIILASKSPRRKELLGLICKDFEIIPAVNDEVVEPGTAIEYVAEKLALDKCKEVADKNSADLIIACDTVVVLGNNILGKPCDKADAVKMLLNLSGKTHRVISGVAFCCHGKRHSFSVITKVTFRDLSRLDIDEYIATNEPFDKAGAYGIQGYGSLLVKGIEGDYFNVVGLPVSTLALLLNRYF